MFECVMTATDILKACDAVRVTALETASGSTPRRRNGGEFHFNKYVFPE